MARKRDTQHLGTATFALTLLGVLGAAGMVIFGIGKDVGAYEERLAQLERRNGEMAQLERP